MRMLIAFALILALTHRGYRLPVCPAHGTTTPAKPDAEEGHPATSAAPCGRPPRTRLSSPGATRDGRGVDLRVEPTTSIRKGSKSIVAGDLKPGDAVQVRFSSRTARRWRESILVKAETQPPKVAHQRRSPGGRVRHRSCAHSHCSGVARTAASITLVQRAVKLRTASRRPWPG